MKWLITGILFTLLASLPALAGEGCSCGGQHHDAAAEANDHPDCCSAGTQPCDCQPELCPCKGVEVKHTDCLGLPYTDEGCWIIDPCCCPRDEYRLVCPARGEFRLLCKSKCEKHRAKPKCKQDTCSCTSAGDD
jgi:hypothetical protein